MDIVGKFPMLKLELSLLSGALCMYIKMQKELRNFIYTRDA